MASFHRGGCGLFDLFLFSIISFENDSTGRGLCDLGRFGDCSDCNGFGFHLQTEIGFSGNYWNFVYRNWCGDYEFFFKNFTLKIENLERFNYPSRFKEPPEYASKKSDL